MGEDRQYVNFVGYHETENKATVFINTLGDAKRMVERRHLESVAGRLVRVRLEATDNDLDPEVEGSADEEEAMGQDFREETYAYRVGDFVEIEGLVVDRSLNGETGEVVTQLNADGRVGIEVNGRTVLIKEVNLFLVGVGIVQ